ncbi:hypothetical protein NDU88_002362 [Pleurodeles waltl]|uniref:Uncharacterized protein n=1 Tax=Pleurodeles waltl TaxID=8319 RepID=A0AAV7MP57_PLEWA|nr:hypothetical protein NDU88_002362 [Pleurodeles waltl]
MRTSVLRVPHLSGHISHNQTVTLGKVTWKKDLDMGCLTLSGSAGSSQDDGVPASPVGPPGGPTLEDILQVITASREALETTIDMLGADLGILKDDHRRMVERVTTAERELV